MVWRCGWCDPIEMATTDPHELPVIADYRTSDVRRLRRQLAAAQSANLVGVSNIGKSALVRDLCQPRDGGQGAVAAEDVARKEAADGLTPSLPQMSEGAEIGAVLDRVLDR